MKTFFTPKDAQAVLRKLKKGDAPLDAEVDLVFDEVNARLRDHEFTKTRRHSRLARGAFHLSYFLVFYVILCHLSYVVFGARLPPSLLEGLSPSNHPWISMAVFSGATLLGTSAWRFWAQKEYEEERQKRGMR